MRLFTPKENDNKGIIEVFEEFIMLTIGIFILNLLGFVAFRATMSLEVAGAPALI